MLPDSSIDDADTPRLESWGPLTIRAQIGRGRFGTVFRAWEPGLERDFALKLLHDAPLVRDDAALKEARLLARIRHPNVVTIFGVDCFDNRVGFWMELVNGRTLKDIVEEQGPFSAQEAVVFGLDLCRALAAVHQAGFLHRDVKAQNVMREAGGRIVLMDFGAAAVMSTGSQRAPDLKGTPLYLAPEVLQGDPPSAKSDLYSLGVLLYYLVSGEFPVNGRSLDDIGNAHAHGRRRSLRDARPDLPSGFVRVVDDATAALPERRPDSAGLMEALLENAVGRGTLGRAPAPPAHRQPQPADCPSIAVLPFVDMTPEKNLEFFCHGIAEEIINALIGVSGLRVVSLSSALRFKTTDEDVRRIGTMLNVETVLEGSVRAAGNRLRVISRLINAADGIHLWSERFDRDLDDVFAVQDEIAKAAVSALGVRIKSGPADFAALPKTPNDPRPRRLHLVSEGPALLEPTDGSGAAQERLLLRGGDRQGSELRGGLRRPGRSPCHPGTVWRARAARRDSSSEGRRPAGDRHRRHVVESLCHAGMRGRRLRLGLAGGRAPVPPRHRAEPGASRRPSLVCDQLPGAAEALR